MNPNSFGDLVKQYRIGSGKTLREFCLEQSFDAGNYSRLERGLYPPPQSREKLEEYAEAFGLAEGSDEWIEFFDFASASRGEFPPDLMTDRELIKKIPLRFQAMRVKNIDKLIEQIDKERTG